VILGLVQRALRAAGVPDDEVAEFVAEATASDYDGLLVAVMTWVDVR
jgi:hypothetical protein